MIVFKALSCKTRIDMLKLLMMGEYHVSGLARALKISVPVAAKHIRILEAAELVERRIFGKVHILKANKEKLYEAMETFGEVYGVEVAKGTSVLDVLKQVATVEVTKIDDDEFVASIDGVKGIYLYEVDGAPPDRPINEYKMVQDEELVLKRLVPVLEKRVKVKVTDNVENHKY
jgi:DNA-binding transcriptional ArsR family regulator